MMEKAAKQLWIVDYICGRPLCVL